VSALLEVEGLEVEYRIPGGRRVHAVSGIDLTVAEGETLGLVGESGCGKSSAGRAILQLQRAKGGAVRFEGRELTTMGRAELRRTRRRLQIIFQDPASSLNPRRRVKDLVAEPFGIWGDELAGAGERSALVEEALDAVGLDPVTIADRRPHELSGGQCQRVSLARALIVRPRLVVCDEPVSALDVSVQAQILNLLEDMRERFGLSLLFIAHDLAVVKNVSDRIAVMYLGRICETAPAEEIHRHPRHPYTAALLAAVPDPDPTVVAADVAPIEGELPSPVSPPSGCRFRTRCPRAAARCADEVPELLPVGPAHTVACHFPLEAA